jgi:phosphoglycerate dehydrogenase-like enzyme
MPTLLILSRNAAEYRRHVEAARLPGLEILPPDHFSEAEIVFGEPNLICAALPQLTALQWAQSTWAGVEPLLNPDLRRDYQLTNARGVFGGLMSEYVFGYLLLHERKMLPRLAAQLHRTWDASPTGTLRGKTLGLLGVGSIGAELARTAKFFGMTVRGFTRLSETCPQVDQYFHGPDLLRFAAGLDYLVSVLPNTTATRQLVGANLLAALPASALFINVGRGSAVDESALIHALETEALAGAVLDVFAEEPLPVEHPFWQTKNLLLTFHTSAPSFPLEISKIFIENYARYVAGSALWYCVDFERGY